MAEILFKNETDLSNDWLFYIENEAKSLATREEFSIQNYLDREILNPDMKTYLSSDELGTMLNSIQDTELLHLNLSQSLKVKAFPDWFKPRFRKLKAKVKKIFCDVVHGIGEIDTKGIIKAVLLALIPAFATGIPAVILPIIIGLLAFMLKYGIEKACPI